LPHSAPPALIRLSVLVVQSHPASHFTPTVLARTLLIGLFIHRDEGRYIVRFRLRGRDCRQGTTDSKSSSTSRQTAETSCSTAHETRPSAPWEHTVWCDHVPISHSEYRHNDGACYPLRRNSSRPSQATPSHARTVFTRRATPHMSRSFHGTDRSRHRRGVGRTARRGENTAAENDRATQTTTPPTRTGVAAARHAGSDPARPRRAPLGNSPRHHDQFGHRGTTRQQTGAGGAVARRHGRAAVARGHR